MSDMTTTASSNGHRRLDEPVITTRGEIARQVREEIDIALDDSTRARRVGGAIADYAQAIALVWLGIALVLGGLDVLDWLPIG